MVQGLSWYITVRKWSYPPCPFKAWQAEDSGIRKLASRKKEKLNLWKEGVAHSDSKGITATILDWPTDSIPRCSTLSKIERSRDNPRQRCPCPFHISRILLYFFQAKKGAPLDESLASAHSGATAFFLGFRGPKITQKLRKWFFGFWIFPSIGALPAQIRCPYKMAQLP